MITTQGAPGVPGPTWQGCAGAGLTIAGKQAVGARPPEPAPAPALAPPARTSPSRVGAEPAPTQPELAPTPTAAPSPAVRRPAAEETSVGLGDRRLETREEMASWAR